MNVSIILISVLIAVLIMGMVVALMLNAQAERRKRMMSVMQGGAVAKDDKGKKGASAQDQRRHELAKKLKDSEDERKKKDGDTIAEMIMQAGMNFSVQQFWIGSIVFAIMATSVAYFMGQPMYMVVMIAIISFFGVPKLFLKMKAKKRQKKFLEDFADALESMTRLLKAGMPVSEAISMVAREYTGPMGEEMGRIYDQQKIGIPLGEAVLNGAKRIPLTEMQMFATAIAIQSQTGSSLSEILENLAAVIRARFQMKRKIQALSSEAKASAGIIGALPLLVLGGMYMTNREYIMVLFEHPTGNALLAGAAFWMFCGIMVMRQMINFKI
ncbi:MAG: type II secretion system F family protein [Pseudomonadota bacterium]